MIGAAKMGMGSTPFELYVPTTAAANLVAFWDFSHQDSEAAKLANLEPTPADSASQSAYDLTKNGTGITTSGVGITFDGTSGQSLSISANTTFTNSFHQNNAAYTVVSVLENPSSSIATWFSTTHAGPSSSHNGVQMFLEAGTGRAGKYVSKSTTGRDTFSFDAQPSTGGIFLGLSWNEAGTGFLREDKGYIQIGGFDTTSAAYSSPSGSSADHVFRFGNSPTVPTQGFDNGTVLHACLLFNASLSAATLDTLFDELATFPNYPI